MKCATLNQAQQFLGLIQQKKKSRKELQDIYSSGLFSDLLDADVKKVDRNEFRKLLGITTISKNLIQSFFREDGPVKLCLGNNFKNWILSKMTEIFPEVPKSKKNILPRRMTDKEIISEYKIQPYKSVSELLPMLYEKITKQPNGEDGELLNDGSSNLFYLQLEDRLVVVFVDRLSTDRRWSLSAYGLGDDGWVAGCYVFSRS